MEGDVARVDSCELLFDGTQAQGTFDDRAAVVHEIIVTGLFPRRIVGHVTSNKADKSVSVSIERVVKHPVYGKYIRRTTKVMAHDEDNACREGDKVAITECRPISKRKFWRVVEVIESNETV